MTIEYDYIPLKTRDPNTSYPLKIDYCGICTMPIEYCENSSSKAQCKKWLQENLPEVFEKLNVDLNQDGDDEKSRQKRGGKGSGPKKVSMATQIKITGVMLAGKKKTTVVGLKGFDIELKPAAKYFGSTLASGTSVSEEENSITIQGDYVERVKELIPKKWPSIDPSVIVTTSTIKKH